MMQGKKIVAPLQTQAEVQEAVRQKHKTRSLKRAAELEAAIAEAETRTVPCCGSAHGENEAYIDNCWQCAPWWGRCLPR